MSRADPCRLVLVRHGETDWNATGRWQGHGGGGLSRTGREQAQVTAEWLASTLGAVAFVARSDLERVAETAAPIEARFDAPVRVDMRLRELDCGTWTGRTHAQIAAADPERYAEWRRGADVAPGGGERVAELQARVTEALREHLDALGPAGVGLVVTHGGPVRVGVAGLLGRWVTCLEDACDPVANCSVTVLARSGEHVTVERYGDTTHLDGIATETPPGGPL